jgi:hypothetical protein
MAGELPVTPDEAAGFYEDDEDPAEVFARFDAGAHVVTGRYARGGIVARVPGGSDEVPFPVGGCRYAEIAVAAQIRQSLDYITATYGTGRQ